MRRRLGVLGVAFLLASVASAAPLNNANGGKVSQPAAGAAGGGSGSGPCSVFPCSPSGGPSGRPNGERASEESQWPPGDDWRRRHGVTHYIPPHNYNGGGVESYALTEPYAVEPEDETLTSDPCLRWQRVYNKWRRPIGRRLVKVC